MSPSFRISVETDNISILQLDRATRLNIQGFEELKLVGPRAIIGGFHLATVGETRLLSGFSEFVNGLDTEFYLATVRMALFIAHVPSEQGVLGEPQSRWPTVGEKT